MKQIKRRGRKTVSASAPVVPTPAFDPAAVAAMLASMGLKIVPVGTVVAPIANPVQIMGRPRKLYGVNPNPKPINMGVSTATVWDYLSKHGEQTQRKLEEGTGLTEGQIKGSLRELRLAGWILDREDPDQTPHKAS